MKLPSNKKFGYFFSLVFIFFAWFFFDGDFNFIVTFFLLLSISFTVISFYKADLLTPLNTLWMRLGYALGKIINPIIMGIIFYCLFTPFAIFFKLIGRDELALIYKKKSSYWVVKDCNNQQNNFRNQF